MEQPMSGEVEAARLECRECRAGLMQALAMDLAWNCMDHGVQRVSEWVPRPTAALEASRREVEALRAALRDIAAHEGVGLDGTLGCITCHDRATRALAIEEASE